MNSYLIPANTKRGQLIFNLFLPFDLILFGVGISLSLVLLFALNIDENLILTIIALLPITVTGFLVIPIPNYHNVRVFLITLYRYFTDRQKFIWRGWCVEHGKE